MKRRVEVGAEQEAEREDGGEPVQLRAGPATLQCDVAQRIEAEDGERDPRNQIYDDG